MSLGFAVAQGLGKPAIMGNKEIIKNRERKYMEDLLDLLKELKEGSLKPSVIRNTIKLIEKREKVALMELETLWKMRRLLEHEYRKVT